MSALLATLLKDPHPLLFPMANPAENSNPKTSIGKTTPETR